MYILNINKLNKAAERARGWRIDVQLMGGWTKFKKEGTRGVGNKRGST